MSSFPVFNAIKNKLKGEDTTHTADHDTVCSFRDSNDSNADELNSHSNEETRKETAICVLLEAARHRMMTRKLVGSIKISQMIGIHTSSVENIIEQCEYETNLRNQYEHNMFDDDIDKEKEGSLVGQAKDALNSIEAIIQSLLNRSKSWEECQYKQTTSISRDVSVGFYLPVFMTVGFAITIEISCTIMSLIEYNKHHKANHALNKRLTTIEDGNALVGELVLQGITINMAKKAVVANLPNNILY